MGNIASTQSSLWLVYLANSTGNTGGTMTQRIHYDKGALREATHIKAAARASSDLTPFSQPPSRLPQCQLGTHSPGTHTTNPQALLHGN